MAKIKDLSHLIEIYKGKKISAKRGYEKALRTYKDGGFIANRVQAKYEAYAQIVSALERFRNNDIKQEYPKLRLADEQIKFIIYINQHNLDVKELYKFVEQICNTNKNN